MEAIRLSRSLVVATALVASLVANVTLFVGGVVYSIVMSSWMERSASPPLQ